MRKNERKHTEKNLKKTGKTEKTNLQNRRESSKLEVIGRKRLWKSEVVSKLSKTAQVSENNCN